MTTRTQDTPQDTPPPSTFSGEFVRGKRHGIGTQRVPPTITYSGGYKDDKRDGQGVLITTTPPLTTTYEGSFKNDSLDGFGKETIYNAMTKSSVTREGVWTSNAKADGDWMVTFGDSSIYNGHCVEGRPHGMGVCKYASGDVFSGHFEHGLRSGEGVIVFAGGELYEGTFIGDQPVGLDLFYPQSPGKQISMANVSLSDDPPYALPLPPAPSSSHAYDNGDIYEGVVDSAGLRQGYGKYTRRCGSTLSGGFIDDLVCGDGEMTDTQGSKFVGSFDKNLFIRGTLIFNSGTAVYKGAFLNNLFEGEGELVDESEGYKGAFSKGLKEGCGTCEYGDGSVYVGGWRRGKREGEGVLRRKGEVVYSGGWKEGNKSGQGMTTDYEGGFAAGLYSGFGKLVTGQRTVEGQFRCGALCDGEVSARGSAPLSPPPHARRFPPPLLTSSA